MRLSPLKFAIAFLLISQAAQANLIVNGSFESPGPGGPAVWIEDAGITSWTAGGTTHSATYTRSGDYGISAQDGSLYIVMGHNTTTGATLSQSFTSSAGASYSVGYYVTQQQGSDPNQQVTVQAFDGSTLLGSVSMYISTNPGYWVAGTTLTFVAGASGTTTIKILDSTASGGGALANWGLDNVSVALLPTTAVPEPSTLASLGLAGLLGLAVRSRRRFLAQG